MLQDRPISTERLRTLRDQLVERFTLDELRDLAFSLGVNWDNLAGGTIDAKATSLLGHLNHRLRIRELIERLHELRPGVDWALNDLADKAEPPYRGLEFYREEDAPLFFGRDKLTAELVEKLRDYPLLVVVGASGSGKSSVVRAGLIPALKDRTALPEGFPTVEGSREWTYVAITPTENPLERLALALTRDLVTAGETRAIICDLGEEPAALRLYVRKYLERQSRPRLCLLVDQFEELFTACKDEAQRRAFIDGLLATVDAGGPVTLIITLRADFYHHCAHYDGLRQAVEQRQAYIGAPSADELRQAIVEPARRRGYDLEPGLAELMLRDVGDEPGALPLLSHALLETWARREGRTLTLAGYNEAGGVRGAIARTAERLYGEMDEGQREIARRIFVELAELGEGTEDTRRRLRLDELAGHGWYGGEGATVLEGLVRARLTTADDQTIQIAHEALIREWPRLREWLDADRAGERLRRGLQRAAREWDEHGRDASYLFDGARLAAAQEWAAANPNRMDERAAAFVAAGVAEAERAEREAEEARQRELEQARALAEEQAGRAAAESRRSRVVRWAAVGLGLLALVAVGAAWFAFAQRNEAKQQAERANSRSLSFASQEVIGKNSTLALLLSVEGGQQSDTAEAFNALRPALRAPGIEKLALVHGGELTKVLWNSDETRILTTSNDGTAKVWDAITGKELLSLLHDEKVNFAYWNNDESRIFTASGRFVRVWDATTGELLLVLEHKNWVNQATWNHDGSRILTASGALLTDGAAYLWDTVTGKALLILPHQGGVNQATWNDDESRILTASGILAQLWNASSGEKLLELPHVWRVSQATWNSDESRILTVSDVSPVRIWDGATGEELITLPHEYSVIQAIWDDNSNHILTFSTDYMARVWDATTGEQLLALKSDDQINVAAWNGDGSQIMTASGATTQIWDTASGERLLILPHDYGVTHAIWNDDESRILTASEDGTARIWDVSNGIEALALQNENAVMQAIWNTDESHILTVSGLVARVWKTSTSEIVLELNNNDRINQALWNDDESLILTANGTFNSGTARIWNTTTGKEVLSFRHPGPVTTAKWSNDESRILIAGSEFIIRGTARVWDISTGEELLLMEHDDLIRHAMWNSDESLILTASWDGTTRVWDAATGDQTLMLQLGNPVNHAIWSGDEKRILTAGGSLGSGSAQVWEVTTSKELLSLAHQGSVNKAIWNGDESLILTASDDGTARVWNAITGEEVFTLFGDGSAVLDAHWNAEENQILIATAGGLVSAYYTHMADLIAVACNRLGRNMTWAEWQQYFLGEPYRQTCPNLPVHYTVPEEARP